jgi:hypothetical protein
MVTAAHLTPTLSFNALCRARTTLDDFSHFYLAYHGLQLDAFFRWMPLLVFVECSIYQLDEDNEALPFKKEGIVRRRTSVAARSRRQRGRQ